MQIFENFSKLVFVSVVIFIGWTSSNPDKNKNHHQSGNTPTTIYLIDPYEMESFVWPEDEVEEDEGVLRYDI